MVMKYLPGRFRDPPAIPDSICFTYILSNSLQQRRKEGELEDRGVAASCCSASYPGSIRFLGFLTS
jgi:hypothetical protein